MHEEATVARELDGDVVAHHGDATAAGVTRRLPAQHAGRRLQVGGDWTARRPSHAAVLLEVVVIFMARELGGEHDLLAGLLQLRQPARLANAAEFRVRRGWGGRYTNRSRHFSSYFAPRLESQALSFLGRSALEAASAGWYVV